MARARPPTARAGSSGEDRRGGRQAPLGALDHDPFLGQRRRRARADAAAAQELLRKAEPAASRDDDLLVLDPLSACSELTRPSRICTIRSAIAAEPGSWLTTTTVVSWARASSPISS